MQHSRYTDQVATLTRIDHDRGFQGASSAILGHSRWPIPNPSATAPMSSTPLQFDLNHKDGLLPTSKIKLKNRIRAVSDPTAESGDLLYVLGANAPI